MASFKVDDFDGFYYRYTKNTLTRGENNTIYFNISGDYNFKKNSIVEIRTGIFPITSCSLNLDSASTCWLLERNKIIIQETVLVDDQFIF